MANWHTNNETGYEVETLREVVDEVNVAYELFVSNPKQGIEVQERPYGVRVYDRDAEEVVGLRRYRNYEDAASYFAEVTP